MKATFSNMQSRIILVELRMGKHTVFSNAQLLAGFAFIWEWFCCVLYWFALVLHLLLLV